MKYRAPVPPEEITTRPFRTVSVCQHRERRISITSSQRGKAILLQACTHDGAPLGAPLFIFDREAAEVVGALVDAAAAIGAEILAPRQEVGQ